MSAATGEQRAKPKAEAVQAAASDWLERHEHDDWSTADQKEFDAWLAVSSAHVIAYMRVEDVWNRANRLRALNHRARNTFAFIGRWASLAKIAAVLTVTALVGAGSAVYMFAPRQTIYSTEVGQRENLLLADGSQIELNTDTTLRISKGDGVQTVMLEKGEAFFNIKHDASRLFVVRAGNNRIVDLGTKFLIRDTSDHVKVSVFEGSARFEAVTRGLQTRSTVLAPGDVVVASHGTIFVTRKPQQTLADDLAWRRGELVFHFTSLADAAAEFNRYNQKKIVVRDSAIARLEIGGTFGMHDVAQFGQLAHQLLGIQIDERGGEIVLSR